ncbi:hypothetical protein R3L02_42420 [Streptomyces scabiei]|nr:hypothetical protein [Streptomyces scabiei]MDW8478404.1 hypothetical protein [Streptomyces scabiei]
MGTLGAGATEYLGVPDLGIAAALGLCDLNRVRVGERAPALFAQRAGL